VRRSKQNRDVDEHGLGGRPALVEGPDGEFALVDDDGWKGFKFNVPVTIPFPFSSVTPEWLINKGVW
jgi:hypothetical protein